MKVRKVKNLDGTFRLVDEYGNDVELDLTVNCTGKNIHLYLKTGMEDWEVNAVIEEYGLEFIGNINRVEQMAIDKFPYDESQGGDEECLKEEWKRIKTNRKAFIAGYNQAITDSIDRLNEALDIDGSYLRELLTDPEE